MHLLEQVRYCCIVLQQRITFDVWMLYNKLCD